VTIALHWLTVALVVVLFGTAWIWSNTPRDWHWHPPLEFLHVSFGILFAAVIVCRLAWRAFKGRYLPPAEGGLAALAAQIVHATLYMLLALQAVLGFSLRWLQGEAFSFFGLFSIPDPLTQSRAAAHLLEQMHNFFGWAIVYVALAHAVAALFHHFVLRDRVLVRMAPAAE
jgi:cytochrome b561